MTWRVLREALRPLLELLARESVGVLLDPCCRLVWWQWRVVRLALKGRPARFARWRYRVTRRRCESVPGRTCTAGEAADRMVAMALEGHPYASQVLDVTELRDAPPHRLAAVNDVLGSNARAALATVLARRRRGS